MATKILILEDDHERHKAFRKNLNDADVVIVETAADAISELEKTIFDWLFLGCISIVSNIPVLYSGDERAIRSCSSTLIL